MTSTAFVSAAPVVLQRYSTRLCTSIRATPSVVRNARPASAPLTPHVAPRMQARPDGDDLPDPTALLGALTGALALWLGDAEAAGAAVPESVQTAFKSIPSSLVHPAIMWLSVATTLYTFYLGYQSRQIRSAVPEERKRLVKARVTDRHFRTSATMFAVVTCATFSGMGNTYARAGKLFPGPHLYTGLGLIASMSVMSALVPHMQKGKDWARNSHISLAVLVTGLFLWQAKSGMDIVGKLLKW